MTDKEKKYLSDISNSIQHIHSFTEGVTSFEQYKRNFLLKGAVERHLGIIGEAVIRFLKEKASNKLTHAQQMKSTIK